ncbi:tetratricopeptide repeat protein [bacterium]|nr:tetratricopeptide repeat protein [bacterium]
MTRMRLLCRGSVLPVLISLLVATNLFSFRPDRGPFSDFWARGLLDKEPQAVHYFVPRIDPDSLDTRDILLRAYSFQSADWNERALRNYQSISSLLGSSPLADWAAFWIGEMAQEAGDKSTIREVFSVRSPPWGRFWLGAWLFSERDYDSAIDIFDALSDDESSQTILKLMSGYFLGLSYTRLGQIDKATDTFEGLIEKYPRSLLSGEIKYRMASIAFSHEDWKNCRSHLYEALEFYDLSSRKSAHWWSDEAQFMLGAGDFMEGRHVVAIRRFQKLENSFPESPYVGRLPYLSILGEIETKSTNAARDSALLAALSPDLYADVLLRIAYLFMEDGEFNTAQGKFLEAAEMAEDKDLIGECFLFAGECAYNRRKYDKAIDFYQITHSCCSKRDREASWGLGWSYLRVRNYEDSRIYFTSVFAGEEDEFAQSARLTYAETFLLEGRPKRAIMELNDFLGAANPDLVDNILYDLIIAFKAVGDTDRIIETSQEFMERYRKNPLAEEIVSQYAKILFARGDYFRLISIADQVDIYSISREKADQVRILGERARYHAGIYSDPLEVSEKFLEKYPDSPLIGEVLLDIGSYLCNVGDYEKGAIAFDRLRHRNIPDSLWVEASFRMGLCYLGMGDTTAAKEILSQLLGEFENDPTAARGMISLGDYFHSIGAYESATEIYNSVLESALDTNQVALCELKLAQSYEGLGRLPEARIMLKNIYENENIALQYRQQGLLGLTRVYYSMAEFEEGFKLANPVFDTLPADSFKCELGEQIGKIALRLGWSDIALQRLLPDTAEIFICSGTKDQSILHDLALILEARSSLTDAKRVWEWIIQVSENDSVVAMARTKLKKYNATSPNLSNQK